MGVEKMFCPFCGKELEVSHEPLTGGDVLYCPNCKAEGYGYHEADGSYEFSMTLPPHFEDEEEQEQD